jgi:hypothetical protein
MKSPFEGVLKNWPVPPRTLTAFAQAVFVGHYQYLVSVVVDGPADAARYRFHLDTGDRTVVLTAGEAEAVFTLLGAALEAERAKVGS